MHMQLDNLSKLLFCGCAFTKLCPCGPLSHPSAASRLLRTTGAQMLHPSSGLASRAWPCASSRQGWLRTRTLLCCWPAAAPWAAGNARFATSPNPAECRRQHPIGLLRPFTGTQHLLPVLDLGRWCIWRTACPSRVRFCLFLLNPGQPCFLRWRCYQALLLASAAVHVGSRPLQKLAWLPQSCRRSRAVQRVAERRL